MFIHVGSGCEPLVTAPESGASCIGPLTMMVIMDECGALVE